MGLGPLMLDLVAEDVSPEEKELLQHPFVGAVILFTRNYHDRAQLQHLVEQINVNRETPLLIAVDHEGGRVQRFRTGFSRIPPAGSFRALWDQGERKALLHAKAMGWLMAAELRVIGIDFSFAPVLDLDYGVSDIIGDRAFHRQAKGVIQLAGAYMAGMHEAGMAATGKHFPGHGAVALDSHTDLPIDEREYDEIELDDLQPFTVLIEQGMEAIMPAHVIYQKVDPEPAGFSSFWLQRVLREMLKFDGVIFSDDLNMAATHHLGSFTDRAQLALSAGCDMVLACNNPAGAIELLDNHQSLIANSHYETRLESMRGQPVSAGLCSSDYAPYRQALDIASQYNDR